MSPDQTVLTPDRVAGLEREATEDDSVSEQRYEEILRQLEDHECWGPYFRVVAARLKEPSKRTQEDFINAARVKSLYLEDLFGTAELCAQMVVSLKLTYHMFANDVLPQIIEADDWAAEATLLQGICDKFADKPDFIACLERLCFLFEKKVHQENKLADSYEQLLSVDPNNIKALRYFKLAFTQNHRWDEVVAILEALLKAPLRAQEVFRVAQELAAVLLYQLDRPQDAIRILEDYCQESPLDTSTIHFDAYQKLGDIPGCVRVLRGCLVSDKDAQARVGLHYRIGQLLLQLGDKTAAEDSFEKGLEAGPETLPIIEALIQLKVEQTDWLGALRWLTELKKKIDDQALLVQLNDAIKRLEDGIKSQQPHP